MKTVEVKEQVRLSLAKCFELVLSGVKYRVRAAITVTIIALATAFLATMLTESLAARTVSTAIKQQIYPRQQFILLCNRMSLPLTRRQLMEDLAESQEPTPQKRQDRLNRLAEFTAWGQLNEQELQQLVLLASRQMVYQAFFQRLTEGQRRALVGKALEENIFESLNSASSFALFTERLGHLGMRGKFPDSDPAEFKDFLAQWQQAQPLRRRILDGHAVAVQSIGKTILQGRDTKAVVAGADESLLKKLGRHGFVLSKDAFGQMQQQAALGLDLEKVTRLFSNPQVRTRLATRLHKKVKAVKDETVLLREARSASGAQWLLQTTRELNLPLELTVARIREVARHRLAENKVSRVESIVAHAAGKAGLLGFSDRTLWLIIVSFMVCIVGIANALLMSVTERFREIATMKCLGATDGFIMINFILESCMQGIAGGIIGAALGLLLGTLRSWWKYGLMALQHFPASQAFSATGLTVIAGILISALAAVYPAWVAARLAPMEAMRIE